MICKKSYSYDVFAAGIQFILTGGNTVLCNLGMGNNGKQTAGSLLELKLGQRLLTHLTHPFLTKHKPGDGKGKKNNTMSKKINLILIFKIYRLLQS